MLYRLTYRHRSSGLLHQFLIQQSLATHILQAQSLLRYLDLSPLGRPSTVESGRRTRGVPLARSAGFIRERPAPRSSSLVLSTSRRRQEATSAMSEQKGEEDSITSPPDEVLERERDVAQEGASARAAESDGLPEARVQEPNTPGQPGAAPFPHQRSRPTTASAIDRPPPHGQVELPPSPPPSRTPEMARPNNVTPEHAADAPRSIDVDQVEVASPDRMDVTLEPITDSSTAFAATDDIAAGFETEEVSSEPIAHPMDDAIGDVPDAPSSEPVAPEPASVVADAPASTAAPNGVETPVPRARDIPPKSDEGDTSPPTSHSESSSERRPEEAPAKQERLAMAEGEPPRDLPSEVDFAPGEPRPVDEWLTPEQSNVQAYDRAAHTASDREVVLSEAEAPEIAPAGPHPHDMRSTDRPAAEQRPEPSTNAGVPPLNPSVPEPAGDQDHAIAVGPVIDRTPDREGTVGGETDESDAEASKTEAELPPAPMAVGREGDRTVDRSHQVVGAASSPLPPSTSEQPVEIRVARRISRPLGQDPNDSLLTQPEALGTGAEVLTSGRQVDDYGEASGPATREKAAGVDPSTRQDNHVDRSPVEAAMDELFATRDTDRSPQAWLARLKQAALEEERAASGGPPVRAIVTVASGAESPGWSVPPLARPPSAPPTPLPDSTRRFLRPLVGMDPAAVQVHRDERAAEITQVLEADALAVGDTVVLGPGRSLETPESIGLLAHEMTHIARRRTPRFVPPVVGGSIESKHAGGADILSEDEALARRVETAVTRAARADQSPRAGVIGARPVGVSDVDNAEIAPAGSVERSGRAFPPHDPWSGLPAPWEPLPVWLNAPPPAQVASVETTAAAPPVSGGAPAASPQVLPATQGRELPEEPRGAPAGSSTHQGAPVEPDLDLLARQVYSILKRRLDTERRRTG